MVENLSMWWLINKKKWFDKMGSRSKYIQAVEEVCESCQFHGSPLFNRDGWMCTFDNRDSDYSQAKWFGFPVQEGWCIPQGCSRKMEHVVLWNAKYGESDEC